MDKKIAETLGTTPGAVRSTAAVAIAKLRRGVRRVAEETGMDLNDPQDRRLMMGVLWQCMLARCQKEAKRNE